MSEKPNCFTCQYRGSVPGSAHSSCRHPSIPAEHRDNMFVTMAALLSGSTSLLAAIKELEIAGNAHGISKGWFLWPANFDPVWLENCNGHTEQKNAEGNQ